MFIYFSGHGIKEGANGYFMASDSDPARPQRSAMEYDYYRNQVNQVNCRHILVAIDACHSATFDPSYGFRNDGRRFQRKGEEQFDRILANHESYKARCFWTSDGQGEQTPDRSNFAYHLLEGLRSRKYAAGYLRSSELFSVYLEQASPKPGGGRFGDDEPNSCFLFFPETSVRADPQRYEARQRDIDAYTALQANPTISGCQQYLEDFPRGNFRTEVTTLVLQLQDEQEWQFASLKNTVESYQAYLERYPNGKYAREAQSRADGLRQAAGAQPSQGRAETSQPSAKPPDNMVFIQGGSFEMGDTFGDGSDDEKPAHTVTVSDFYLAIHETTFDEFDAFCEATGREKPDDRGWGRGRRPVIYVSWNDAVEYCNWRSRQEQLQEVYAISGTNVIANWNANGYRLPTEAEWEFAARSRGKKEKWAGTSEESSLASYANYSEKGSKDGYEYTAPVGSLRANSVGLHDMSGNVWEWCWDWYDSGYYEKSKNSRDPRGPDSGSGRVIRGGSWLSNPASVRVAYRDSGTPDLRYYALGFRLARAVR
ncbi:MAG: formylglycine-generating enzyme family protein [Phaeodactylibacter sp.]|nr:formylglycine-generating enzyme family protein [Phaeodactylibacter sp.]